MIGIIYYVKLNYSITTMKRKVSIKIENLTVRLGGITILDNINSYIGQGTINSIIGPNGAGKTTLLNTLLGCVDYEGKVLYLDEHDNEIKPRMSYVPQKMEFDRGIPLTVYDFMSMSHCRHPLWIPHKKDNLPLIESRLSIVAAGHLMFRQFGKLSGGEIQRVMLALALMNDPEVLLMDEPEAGIDVMGEQLFKELLKNIRDKSEMTLVFVSHDLSLVNSLSDNVLCINRVIQCQGSSPEVMTSENLRTLFGGDSGIYKHEHH